MGASPDPAKTPSMWRRGIDRLHRPVVRFLRGRRLWLAERPFWMVAVLGFFGFWVLSMPAAAWTGLVDFSSCLFPPTGEACSSSEWLSVSGRLLIEIAIYLVAFYVLSQIVGAIIWSRMRRMAGRDARCRALIMGLSDLNESGLKNLPGVMEHFAGQAKNYALPRQAFNLHLAERGLVPPEAGDLSTRKPAVSGFAIQWQQNVRAICQHGAQLEFVVALLSDKSYEQRERFLAFIECLFPEPPNVAFVSGDDGAVFSLKDEAGRPQRDYEDYTYVREGLDRAVDQLRATAEAKGRKLTEGDICIDVTPGPKLFSIGAAIVTLNRDLRLSYVTNDGEVRVFDVEIGTADSLTRTLN